MTIHRVAIGIVASLALCASAARSGQDPVSTAKSLYASADYEEALKLLQQAPDSREVLYYRALCLVGLDRFAEAEKQFTAVVRLDPLYVPDPAEVSPRVIANYTETRRRLLPEIVRTKFNEAKRLFDAGEAEQAREQFELTIQLLNDPLLGEGHDLADLKVVAAGFRDLVRAAKAQAPPPSSPPPAANPPIAETGPAESAQPAAAAQDTISPPSVLTPAIPIAQAFPAWRPTVAVARRVLSGEVEVEIDDMGRVIAARMTRSVHPSYDPLVLAAARMWTYRPAMRNGAPVASVAKVPIQLRPVQ
jgi:hypothetical protein